jgi:hypothetical protein
MAQEEEIIQFNTKIDTNIRTLKFHKKGNQMSDPILSLDRNQQLVLNFDLIDLDYGDLAYEILLCDKDWKLSSLDMSYYQDGFYEYYIRDYQSSINTYVNYMHYQTEFPNDDLKIKLSGNYIIRVYPESEKTRIILQKRFMVVESGINVEAKVEKPDVQLNARYQQQLNINVKYPEDISDPLVNLYMTIRQNHSWLNAIDNIQADYVQDNTLFFNDRTKFTFDGNNEFRQLDLKYHRAGNLEIEKIVKEGNQFNVYIKDNKKKSFHNYIYKEEINGRYIVKNDEAQDDGIEADYFKVHFELISNYFFEGDIYVYGEFTDWEIREENKLIYDKINQKYFLSKDIKQGMMNYSFVLLEKSTGKKNIQIIEGNHFETENDYDIILYYRDLTTGSDRILGLYSFNSLY